MIDTTKTAMAAAACAFGVIGVATVASKAISDNPWVRLGAAGAMVTVAPMVLGVPPKVLWEQPEVPIALAVSAVNIANLL